MPQFYNNSQERNIFIFYVTANILETALLSVGRQDIVQECILNSNEKSKIIEHNDNTLSDKNIISGIMKVRIFYLHAFN